MAETKKVEIMEDQLVQMAQQEEQNLLARQQNLERMSNALRETINAKEILKEIQTNKENVMIRIGAGILIEAKPLNTEKCKRTFSENGYKEETIKETLEVLTKREEQLKKQIEKVSQEYNASEQKYASVIGILKQIETEKKKAFEIARKQPPTISK